MIALAVGTASFGISGIAVLSPGSVAAAWHAVTPDVRFVNVAPSEPQATGPFPSVSMGPTPTPTALPSAPASSLPAAQAADAAGTEAQLAAKAEVAASSRRARMAAMPLVLKLMTYNVLGSSHTAANGDEPWYGSGVERAHWASQVVRLYSPAIVGLQEIEFDQLGVMEAELPGYQFYPGTASDEPSVRTNMMWDKSRFTMTQHGFIAVKFVGYNRTDPYVQLRDNATGRLFWVFNVHNSPNRGKNGTFFAERKAQLDAEIAVVNQLVKSAPVMMVGDFNDHAYTYCRIVGETPLRAAQGGSVSPCQQPALNAIDWIFGTGASWSDVHRDRGPLVARSTDHHIFVATATLG